MTPAEHPAATREDSEPRLDAVGAADTDGASVRGAQFGQVRCHDRNPLADLGVADRPPLAAERGPVRVTLARPFQNRHDVHGSWPLVLYAGPADTRSGVVTVDDVHRLTSQRLDVQVHELPILHDDAPVDDDVTHIGSPGAMHQAPDGIEDRLNAQSPRRDTDQIGERPAGDLAEPAPEATALAPFAVAMRSATAGEIAPGFSLRIDCRSTSWRISQNMSAI